MCSSFHVTVMLRVGADTKRQTLYSQAPRPSAFGSCSWAKPASTAQQGHWSRPMFVWPSACVVKSGWSMSHSQSNSPKPPCPFEVHVHGGPPARSPPHFGFPLSRGMPVTTLATSPLPSLLDNISSSTLYCTFASCSTRPLPSATLGATLLACYPTVLDDRTSTASTS